jgi:hypothetical protein
MDYVSLIQFSTRYFRRLNPIPHTTRPGSAAKQTFLNMKEALKRRKGFLYDFSFY